MTPYLLVTFAAGTLALLTVTLLPLSRNPHWLIRGADFPRLQFSVLAGTLLFGEWFLLDSGHPLTWVLVALTGGCLGWQLSWILPYTFLWPTEVRNATTSDTESTLSILTANVLTPNREAGSFLDLVREYEPDILVTLESDLWWQDRLDSLEPSMPYTLKCPLDNLYGMHLYSRLPLENATIEYLVEKDVPSMHALVRMRTGDGLRVHLLHPAPPSPAENPESAERDAELVIVARSVAATDEPTIVAGDLNDVAWSATTRLFRKLSGLLDPRVGRGMYNTFHAKYPFARWPLDHLFHSQHFTLRSIRRLPPIGSDHFGLFTELSYAPIEGADQKGLDDDQDDRAWARSVADQKDVGKLDVPRPESV